MSIRTIESPSGIGQIYKDGQFLMEVRYHLNVYRQFSTLHTTGGSTEIAGNKRIEGNLSGGNFFNLGGEHLTLHLDDDRCLDFMFTRTTGSILGSGDFYLCGEK